VSAAHSEVARRLDELLERLRDRVGASRTTIRIDIPAWGVDVNDVIAEAHADGMRSLRGERSLDQRALPTVRFLEERRVPLVQPEFRTTEHPPPQALIDVYGVQAQMLAPLVHGGDLVGWVSVHEVGREREWEADEVAVLETAAGEALAVLTAGGAFAEAG
jgi:maleate isomerase